MGMAPWDFPDFLAFVEHFGTSRGDGKYEAKYDLDGNGTDRFFRFSKPLSMISAKTYRPLMATQRLLSSRTRFCVL